MLVPIFMHDRAVLFHGDSAELDVVLPPNSIDAIVADPPSGIAFMGKSWDKNRGGRDQWIAWLAALLRPAYDALKPGGHMLLWAIPRTSHWTATAIEDAGFEIRDVHHHFFGSGFPKSLTPKSADIPEGTGTALKPAVEHWILARKPLAGTVEANVKEFGTGVLNIDACRIGTTEDCARKPSLVRDDSPAGFGKGQAMGGNGSDLGRWPAHLSFEHAPGCQITGLSVERRAQYVNAGENHRDGDEGTNLAKQITVGEVESVRDVYTCVIGCPVRILDEQSAAMGMHSAGSKKAAGKARGSENAVTYKHGGGAARHGDKGGASRFFYVAKGARSEKDAGLAHLPAKSGGEATGREDDSAGVSNPRAGAGRTGGARNFHPTVKSISLMQWLIRLITPPGGTVLDMFAGSGSTGVAAIAEGCSFVGVEMTDEYLPILVGRIAHALGEAPPSLPRDAEEIMGEALAKALS